MILVSIDTATGIHTRYSGRTVTNVIRKKELGTFLEPEDVELFRTNPEAMQYVAPEAA